MKKQTKTRLLGLMLSLVILPLVALGQSNIDLEHKFCWGENVGWTNWRDANNGEQGVIVDVTFLGGFIWTENLGWINVGDGSPAVGKQYANQTGEDFGVNVDTRSHPPGELFGLAWSENAGWINFDTREALGEFGQQARFDLGEQRFRGFAWGENVGWINLDDEVHYVGVIKDCTGNEKVRATCRPNNDGLNVISAKLKKAEPGTLVRFCRDGRGCKWRKVNDRGVARANWRRASPGDHTISVELACDEVLERSAECPT